MSDEADWYSVWQIMPVPPIGKASCAICGLCDKGAVPVEDSKILAFQNVHAGVMCICKSCALRLGLKLLHWADTPDGERYSGG